MKMTVSPSRRWVSLLALVLTASSLVRADVVLRSGVGAAPDDLQGMIDLFKSDLGGVDNGASPGLFNSGYRSISWETVPDESAAPNFLPGDFFLGTDPRGAEILTAGSGLQVSGTVASGVPVNFGNIDLSYGGTFQGYSGERLFTPVGSTVTDFQFFVPGDPAQAAFVSGFGSVFSDVDLLGETSIELYDVAGNSLFTGYVPPSADGLSFLGIHLNAGEQIGRVRITTGNAPLGAGVVDGGDIDLVVMDNVWFGEPLAVPEPSSLALGTLGFSLWIGFQFWRRKVRAD